METTPHPMGSLRQIDPRALLPVVLCLAAPFFDVPGWLLAIAGVALLWRAPLAPRTKWLLAAAALLPKVLFLVARVVRAPRGLSFVFEPWTLASSSSVWAWSGVIAALGVFTLLQRRSDASIPPGSSSDPSAPVPAARQSVLVVLAGLALIVASVVVLLGLTDDFQRIDDAGDGAWALKHALRGTVATFTRGELARIDGSRTAFSRTSSQDVVRVTLTDGRSYSVATRSPGSFDLIRTFACTANLAPGQARITERHGKTWTNGSAGFSMWDFVGVYEDADKATAESSRIEFAVAGGRLVGTETERVGDATYVRPLENIAIRETGEMTFHPGTLARAGAGPNDTSVVHLAWSGGSETGRLSAGAFETAGKRYVRR